MGWVGESSGVFALCLCACSSVPLLVSVCITRFGVCPCLNPVHVYRSVWLAVQGITSVCSIHHVWICPLSALLKFHRSGVYPAGKSFWKTFLTRPTVYSTGWQLSQSHRRLWLWSSRAEFLWRFVIQGEPFTRRCLSAGVELFLSTFNSALVP